MARPLCVCGHPGGVHRAVTGPCRLNGCSCAEFTSPEPKAAEAGPQRVCVDVPPGYAVQFQIVPTEEPDGATEA